MVIGLSTWRPGTVDCIVVLAGAVVTLGFAPFGVAPLPIVALAVLFLACLRCTAKRAFWRGWLFGLGMFATGVSWVVESFQHSNVALPSAVTLTSVMVIFLALLPALALGLWRRLSPSADTFALLLALPAAWTLSEWGRGSVLTGFSFLQLGYSQIDTPMSALAALLGIYGANACVAFNAALLAWVAASPGLRWRRGSAAIAAIWAALFVLQSVAWTAPDSDPLRVTVVQGNIPQTLKWRPEYKERTLTLYRQQTARHWDSDLIVWPETALPGLYRSFQPFLEDLEAEARRNETDLLIGVPSMAESDTGERRFYNSVVSIGSRRALYHKRHLVPFGEYLPLQPLLQPLVDLFRWPVSSFAHGAPDQTTLDVARATVGVSVCFEVAFGHDIMAAVPAAGLLVNLSNDAWFGDSIGPHQHLAMARWRAMEAGRPLVRATNTGISAFISADGEITARAAQFTETTLTGMVTPLGGVTPYARLGDAPVLLGLVLLWLVPVAYGRSKSMSDTS